MLFSSLMIDIFGSVRKDLVKHCAVNYKKIHIFTLFHFVFRDVCTSAPYAKPNLDLIVPTYANSQALPPPSSRGPCPNEASAHWASPIVRPVPLFCLPTTRTVTLATITRDCRLTYLSSKQLNKHQSCSLLIPGQNNKSKKFNINWYLLIGHFFFSLKCTRLV